MHAKHPRNGKKYKIKGLRVFDHEFDIPNEDGTKPKKEIKRCVDFTIVGNNKEWKDWTYYEDFKKDNPKIDI